MKRTIILILLAGLIVAVLPAQDVDLQMALATQALNQNMLFELGLSEEETGEILSLQERFRLKREQTTLDMNIIKAQIAQKLYYANADSNEVARLLEKAGELRLEQEKAQVEAYLQIRNQLGEDNWSELLRRTRTQIRSRQQAAGDSNPRNNSGSGSSGSSGNSGTSGNSGSGSGSSNR